MRTTVLTAVKMESFLRTGARILKTESKPLSILKGYGVTVIILSEKLKPYRELATRSRRRRHESLPPVLNAIGMSIADMYHYCITQRSVKDLIGSELSTPGSHVQKMLKKKSVPIPLPPSQVAALYIEKNYTESQVQFNRSYLSIGPSRQVFRKEKQKYICNMPDIYILRSTSNVWERVVTRRLRDEIPASREKRYID